MAKLARGGCALSSKLARTRFKPETDNKHLCAMSGHARRLQRAAKRGPAYDPMRQLARPPAHPHRDPSTKKPHAPHTLTPTPPPEAPSARSGEVEFSTFSLHFSTKVRRRRRRCLDAVRAPSEAAPVKFQHDSRRFECARREFVGARREVEMANRQSRVVGLRPLFVHRARRAWLTGGARWLGSGGGGV